MRYLRSHRWPSSRPFARATATVSAALGAAWLMLNLAGFAWAESWPGSNYPTANPPWSVGSQIAWWAFFWALAVGLLAVTLLLLVALIAGGFKQLPPGRPGQDRSLLRRS
jgi:hypothetical protein